jgi:hypothetical protein
LAVAGVRPRTSSKAGWKVTTPVRVTALPVEGVVRGAVVALVAGWAVVAGVVVGVVVMVGPSRATETNVGS